MPERSTSGNLNHLSDLLALHASTFGIRTALGNLQALPPNGDWDLPPTLTAEEAALCLGRVAVKDYVEREQGGAVAANDVLAALGGLLANLAVDLLREAARIMEQATYTEDAAAVHRVGVEAAKALEKWGARQDNYEG